MKDLAVEQQTVLELDVIAEPLSMIGEQADDGVVVEAAFAQRRDQLTDERVGVAHLAVVGVLTDLVEGGRRQVGRMRLEEVDEEEKRSRIVRRTVERVERGCNGRFTVPLREGPARAPLPRGQRIVVVLEALSDPGRSVQHGRGDGADRAVTGGRKSLGQRLGAIGKGEAEIVAHAVVERQRAGQDRGVRRQCQRIVRVGALEEHRFGG